MRGLKGLPLVSNVSYALSYSLGGTPAASSILLTPGIAPGSAGSIAPTPNLASADLPPSSAPLANSSAPGAGSSLLMPSTSGAFGGTWWATFQLPAAGYLLLHVYVVRFF